MIIRQLSLFLSAAEVAQRLQTALSGVEQIGDPAVQLADGRIDLNGVFKAGLSIPFGTSWTVEVLPGNRLALRLTKFNAGVFGGSSLGGQVLAMLATRLAGRDGLTVEGDRLTLALNPLLAQQGIELAGSVNSLILSPAGAEITVTP